MKIGGGFGEGGPSIEFSAIEGIGPCDIKLDEQSGVGQGNWSRVQSSVHGSVKPLRKRFVKGKWGATSRTTRPVEEHGDGGRGALGACNLGGELAH